MSNKFYVVYYKDTGVFYGFYNEEEIVQNIISENNYLTYKEISQDIHDYLLNNIHNIKEPIINIESITSNIKLIDSKDYLVEQTPKTPDFESIKESLISDIKRQCGVFIENGAFVELSNGDLKEFSFKIEDQINLKLLIDNINSNTNTIYYHANGEFNTEYTYEDIIKIYKELYNNKIYNQVYTQVLCDWISTQFTQEMYDSKEYIIEYGYSNSQILKEVNSIYERNKLL